MRSTRATKEIKLRLDRREEITFEFLTLPEYVCLISEHRGGAGLKTMRGIASCY